MKISIDLDGTLYAFPEFFRDMIAGLRERGHVVGILTGHKAEAEDHDREKLRGIGIEVDFYLGRTPAYMPLNGSIFKCDMIEQHNIDLHFDDLDYGHPESWLILGGHHKLIRMPMDHAEATKRGWGRGA